MTQLRNISEIEKLTELRDSWNYALLTLETTIPKMTDLGRLPFNETIREEMKKEMLVILTKLHNELAEYGFDTGWNGAVE